MMEAASNAFIRTRVTKQQAGKQYLQDFYKSGGPTPGQKGTRQNNFKQGKKKYLRECYNAPPCPCANLPPVKYATEGVNQLGYFFGHLFNRVDG
eukprot:5936391-Amphidinium_carterae.1